MFLNPVAIDWPKHVADPLAKVGVQIKSRSLRNQLNNSSTKTT
jgi:hypothetical protein